MKLSEILELIDGTVVTTECYDGDKEASNGFVGDLLSVVMGKAKEDCAWVTIQSHINIVAVATLVDMACIIVAEGYKVDDDALAKAEMEEIPILSTKLSSFEACAVLVQGGLA